MVRGSVAAAMVPETRITGPRFTRGKRCVQCRRHLFSFHHPRPIAGRRWEHLSCEGLEAPDLMDFTELAESILARHATGQTRQLRDELAVLRDAFSGIRVQHIAAEQRLGAPADPRELAAVNVDVSELAARCVAIHEELLEQLRRKAQQLHDEWMIGTDPDGKTTAALN